MSNNEIGEGSDEKHFQAEYSFNLKPHFIYIYDIIFL